MYTIGANRTFLLVVCILMTSSFLGQSPEDFKVANKLFDQGKYMEGKEKFSTLLALDQTNSDLNFKYGACLLYADEDKLKGLGHLQYAIKDPSIDARAYYFIGKAYHLNYRFSDAIKAYNRFKSSGSTREYESLNVDQEIKMCNNGKKLLKNISELVVIDKKEVVFKRLQYSYDLRNIGGKVLVTDEFQTSYDKKIGHRPLVHFPSTRQNNIFYSSYGKEGETGKDIYQIKKLPNGNWSKSKKLPIQVNTDTDEDYGFLHPDGMTFYFCSKGHTSMGGYDVFRCSYDSEYNTFGPAQNMDFKINTPDDDILYIVDSLNKEAYFASTRSSRGGYVDVYNVKVEIYPILNAIIAGRFHNEINPTNQGVVIKVKDVIQDEIIGVYNTKSESGKFLIILPKSGRYQYIVESPESEKVHTGLFEIPYQKELKPLKQELALIVDGAEERLVIKNLFDEEVENSQVIMAEVLKQISDVEENVDKLEPLVDSAAVSVEDTLLGILNEEDLTALADTMAVQAAKEAEELKEKRDVAYFVANEKMKSARENAEKAEKVLSGIENVENPQEKRQLLELAAEYNSKSREDNEIAVGALNLGNTLDEQYAKKKEEAEQAKVYASDIKAALNSSSTEDAISRLEELKTYVEDIRTLDVDDKSEFEKISENARQKQAEATSLINKAREFRSDEEDIRQELRNLDLQYNSASKKDKKNIQIRIDETKQLLIQTEKDADKAFAYAREVQKDADILNGEAEVLGRLFDDLADVEATELTEQEKSTLSEQISSGEITSSIESTSTVLADNNVDESIKVDTSSGPGQNLKDRVAEIMSEKENTDYDSVRESLDVMPEGPEKANMVNNVNEAEIDKITSDIATIDEALESETDTEVREELESRKQVLEEEETKLEEEIAQNEDIIKTADTKTTDPVDEIVNIEEYDELSEREKAADNIPDPVDKAKEKEAITDEWIEDLTNDIKEVEVLAANEPDELKKTQYLDKVEELKLEKEKKEEEKSTLSALTRNDNTETYTETNDVTINEEKYDAYENKATGLASIENPSERASAEIELKEEWIDAIETDLSRLNESYNSADDEKKDEIQNQIDVLSLQKTQLNDDITESKEVIDSVTETELVTNTTRASDSTENTNTSVTTPTSETDSIKPSIAVEPTTDFSYTDEKDFRSTESNEVYNEIKEDVEELNDEQIKLEAMKMDLESNTTISDGKKEKLLTQINKQEEKVIEKEIEVAESYVVIHKNEKKELLEEIAESNEVISSSNVNDSPEVARSNEEVAAVNNAFDRAAELRNEASSENDNAVKNNLLKEASALEDGALLQLEEVATNLNVVAETTKPEVVEVKETETVPSSEENAPIEEVEETSLANVESFNSSTSQEMLAEVSEQFEEINEYDNEIDVLELEKEQASEKEIKKLDKKITKIETKKAKIELKVAPEVAEANELEFNQSKNLNESLKSDLKDISNSTESNTAYTDAINYEKVAERQYSEAKTIRENSSSIKDVSERNDALKTANDLEKVAIKNMAAANAMNMKAAELATVSVYPSEGTNSSEMANEELSKQRTLAADLSSEGNVLIMEARQLADSAQLIKDKDEKKRLLAESEETLREGEQKKELSSKLNASADQAETRIIEDAVLASLTTENVKEVRKSPEYKEAHMQFMDRLDRIENSIKNGESLIPQLRTSVDRDRDKAEELINLAAETENEQEKQDLLSQANELERLANEKSVRADSVENDLSELAEMKDEVILARDDYLEEMPNKDLAKMIKAIGRSDFEKVPLSPGEVDLSSIAKSDFEVPNKVEEDIIAIDNAREESNYTEENPIPINPKMPEGLVYRVQVGAFSKPIPQDLFKGFAPLTGEVIRNNITRYRVGYFTRYQNANATRNEIRGLGFDDAFVVAVYNGESVRISEARRLELETLGEAPALASNRTSSSTTSSNTTDNTTNDATNNSTASNTNSNTSSSNNNSTTNNSTTNSNTSSSNNNSTTNNTSDANTSYYEDLEDAPNAQPVESVRGLFYTVQIGAYTKKVTDDDLFNIQPLNVNLTSGGLLRYSTGRYNEIPAASSRKEEVKRIGIRDAFVTVYYNGKRTTFSEARNLVAQIGDGVFSESDSNSDDNATTGQGIEGLEYIIDIGTYNGSVPTEIAEVLLPNSKLIVRKFLDATTLKLTSGPLKTIVEAKSRKEILDDEALLDTTIRAIYNGQEISLQEAEELENN